MPDSGNPAPLDAPSPDTVSEWFPELLSPSLLAVGGTGIVYRFEQSDPERAVALKLVPVAEDEGEAELQKSLFERERDIMARLKHPNIRAVHSTGFKEGHLYAVMEFIEGYTLHQHIAANGPFRAPDALIIVANVASALEHAHSKSVLHLDIKPDNVMIDHEGVTKLMDFGIAQLTDPETNEAPNTREGSHEYAAPEQFMSETLDHRADIFGLGALLFELLKGHPLNRDLQTVAQLGSFPPKLRGILQKLIADSPDARFQSAAEVYAAATA